MIVSTPAERARGAVLSAVLLVGLLWALIAGLAVGLGPLTRDRPGLAFDLASPPPEPPRPRERLRSDRAPKREGTAAPPNLQSTATEVVAPIPPQPFSPPVAAAPVANTGVQPTQGAAPVAGPGTGAGGAGDGFGAGDGGDGNGGGGEGRDTPPRRIGGRIKPGDLPDELAYTAQAGVDLVVGVRYAVEADGRVDDCRITRSSGDRRLDILTCELIERKFRYRPALDDDRQPVRSYIVENHVWNFDEAGGRR